MAAQGRNDILHLVYVAAAMIKEGENFVELGSAFPNYLRDHMQAEDNNKFSISDEGAHACFYNLCDPETAAQAVSRLRTTSNDCFIPGDHKEPWRSIPSTYILCTKDKAIVPELQQFMSKNAQQTITIETDHSPFYSSQNELLDTLCAVSNKVKATT